MTWEPYIIGIAGGSASGKTSFLRDLKDKMPKGSLCIISQDNYYKPIEEQQEDENGEVNFDLPESIDRNHFYDDLKKLRQGDTIKIKEYTFNNKDKDGNGKLSEEELLPNKGKKRKKKPQMCGDNGKHLGEEKQDD